VKLKDTIGTLGVHAGLWRRGPSKRMRLTWISYLIIFVFTMYVSYWLALNRVRGRVHNMRQAEGLLMKGRFEDALFRYDKVLKWNRRVKMAWSGKGLCLLNLGRYEDAIYSYNRAIKLDPQLEFAWHGKGLSSEKLGRYEDALSSYDRVLEINPADRNVRGLRSRCLLKIGQSGQ